MHNIRLFLSTSASSCATIAHFLSASTHSFSSPVCAAYRGGVRQDGGVKHTQSQAACLSGIFAPVALHITQSFSSPVCAAYRGGVRQDGGVKHTQHTGGGTHTTRTSTGVLTHNNSCSRGVSAQNDSLRARPAPSLCVLNCV